jgi:hypothetical protein
MTERRENASLTLEPGQTLLVARQGLGQELQRDVAAELDVFGPIHFTHPAFSQAGSHPIAAEQDSGCEGQIVDLLAMRLAPLCVR